jgi:hypothetical protein
MQGENTTCLPRLKTHILLPQKANLDPHQRSSVETDTIYIYEHTRKLIINKIVHQTDLKFANTLLKQTSSLRRSHGHQERLKRIRNTKDMTKTKIQGLNCEETRLPGT